jgi:hypothetical protein
MRSAYFKRGGLTTFLLIIIGNGVQILAHHPEKAKRLTRAKANGMSISEACATIMKPPSPLVRALLFVQL